MKGFFSGDYDVIVVGGGHAGVEAALASARMGLSTLMLTLNLDGIALMACNPSIGGTSKGHLVRELDALGGQMGLSADATALQIKMLNTSKGPAVQSLRAQADKKFYQRHIKGVLEQTDHLQIAQGECVRIRTLGGRIRGISTATGAEYSCRALVLATGVYLKARVIIGEYSALSGPSGLFPANKLSAELVRLGFKLRRFKTGTPARVDGRSLDYSKMEPQYGQDWAPSFSFLNDSLTTPNSPCYLTHTTVETHRIIRENLHRSPLFSGIIEGTGPRYCPSIEDKVVRFADKESHQVFIEPEGADTTEMYVQGMSTSLPVDVQAAMLRTLPGLENVRITRPGYAIEYDCIDATQLLPSLGSKAVRGLFFAGQINGSSGYEEAAAQGLLAGINAARFVQERPPVILSRTQAYIGVLVDDLVTKGTMEPYRMMTSRAEYRLTLRQDNADLRLTPIGYEIGLASEERYQRMREKEQAIQSCLQHFASKSLAPSPQLDAVLEAARQSKLAGRILLEELLRRPGIGYPMLRPFDPQPLTLPPAAIEQAEINIKYEGYIRRQQSEIQRQQRLENLRLPETLDYREIRGLRIEAQQKLNALRPTNIGQAGRISGVSPADIAVLLIFLDKIGKSAIKSASVDTEELKRGSP